MGSAHSRARKNIVQTIGNQRISRIYGVGHRSVTSAAVDLGDVAGGVGQALGVCAIFGAG